MQREHAWMLGTDSNLRSRSNPGTWSFAVTTWPISPSPSHLFLLTCFGRLRYQVLLHLFFSWIIFLQLSPSLSADVLCEAWGLLKRFYDSVAFLAQASACMTHGSARVGVSSLELAWVVPHLHLFLSHVMSSSLRSVLPLLRHANMISYKCFTTFKVSKIKAVWWVPIYKLPKEQKGAKELQKQN